MTIPQDLKELREVHSCQAANELLAARWELITVAVNLTSSQSSSYFLMGWCGSEKVQEPHVAARRPGNLATDARL